MILEAGFYLGLGWRTELLLGLGLRLAWDLPLFGALSPPSCCLAVPTVQDVAWGLLDGVNK